VATEHESYWRTQIDDAAMQQEHAFIWQAMLDTVDVDLRGKRVLDAGCNQGGFLRLLSDSRAIAAGSGYDPAFGAIADARRLTDD
jgi:2-polyprenyl-3-methyl-5-hydroxy-6-metoxy-1,4-benzoquinol methylase